MKKEDLLDAIGEVDDQLIAEAAKDPADGSKQPVKNQKQKIYYLRRYGGIAAAACVCVVCGGIAVRLFGIGMMGSSSSTSSSSSMDSASMAEDAAESAGIAGSSRLTNGLADNAADGDSYYEDLYTSYEGPVFPLSLAEENDAITAVRDVLMDFSSYSEEEWRQKCSVTDRYELTNTSDEDQTVVLKYPFSGSVTSNTATVPTLTEDGERLQSELLTGALVDDTGEALSWEAYQAAAESGGESSDAFALPDQKVIVYEVSGFYGAESNTTDTPTISMTFTIDYAKTRILTWDFNSTTDDIESGACTRSFWVPGENDINYGQSKYLIVIGDDIGDYTLRGYTDMECTTELSSVGADVKRYETTLGEILCECAQLYLQNNYGDGNGMDADSECLGGILDADTYTGLAAELIRQTGIADLNDPAGVDRSADADSEEDIGDNSLYTGSTLEDLFMEVDAQKRILYETCEITIPAGETVTVEADMVKDASMDYIGDASARNGYDLCTGLGSCLEITEQSAEISGAEDITILRQNFGFDPDNKICRIEMDPAEAYYYMDVCRQDND